MATAPADAEATIIANLAEKTGKPLDEWIRVAAGAKLSRHGEIVNLLKSKHGLGHGYANLVAHKFADVQSGGPADADDLVTAQYAGPKAELRRLYEKLIAAIRKLGPDVEISPKKTYVSLRRSKQFALIQPSTATRLDVGINLKGVPAKGRLEASGSFNAMVSHRVRVESAAEIDAELLGWIKQAYAAA
jgi:predicted transport protein